MLLRMKPCLCLLILFMIGVVPALGQLEDAAPETQAKCKRYAQTPLPAEAALVSTPKQWPECNSYKLYSGLGLKVDFAAARKCAWAERLATLADIEPKFTVASVFGGSAMLATLYANGEGVERSIPLALRFACEEGWSPAEFDGRIEHLESLELKPADPANQFSYCDDITSGAMQGYCAAYDREITDQGMEKTMNSLPLRFTEPQRTAFSALVKAEQAYAMAHGKGEIDLSGTARAMYQIDAEQTLRDDFLAAVQSFEVGKYPERSAATLGEADARLNNAYKAAMAEAEKHKAEYGAIQPDGIRDAERAWLTYRDAWVEFAKLRYPTVSSEVWLILLTKVRTSILDGSFCDMDAVEGPCTQHGDTWKPSPLP
jgi:uncharacterized protein YecT (DUF1311 family)